jgi:hypothetical protein
MKCTPQGYDSRVCVHRGECVCIVSVYVVLCNSQKNGRVIIVLVYSRKWLCYQSTTKINKPLLGSMFLMDLHGSYI